MTADELLQLCAQAIQIQRESPLPSRPFVRLVLTVDKKPTGRSVRLAGNVGPRGRLDIVRPKDGKFECVLLFWVDEILRFMGR